jgi:hypothetical protein
MRAVAERGPSWAATAPTLQVKEGGYLMSPLFRQGRTYDIAPDGQRFLMIKDGKGDMVSPLDSGAAAAARNLIVVLNWTEELKRLVPQGK